MAGLAHMADGEWRRAATSFLSTGLHVESLSPEVRQYSSLSLHLYTIYWYICIYICKCARIVTTEVVVKRETRLLNFIRIYGYIYVYIIMREVFSIKGSLIVFHFIHTCSIYLYIWCCWCGRCAPKRIYVSTPPWLLWPHIATMKSAEYSSVRPFFSTL